MGKESKKLGLYFISDIFNYQHISKSFVNIPRNIAEQSNSISCEVNYFSSTFFDDEVTRRLSSSPIFKFKILRFLVSAIDLIRKKYDIQMILHLNFFSFMMSELYNIVRRDGILYLKLDISSEFFNKKHSKIRIFYIKRLLRNADVISYESKLVYRLISESSVFSEVEGKLIYLPNCTAETDRYEPRQEDKHKIITTVGRLGTYQKNTELILDVLDEIDLNGWEFHFVGSIHEDIRHRIINSKTKGLKYIGEISDRTEMINIYQQSSVFVLSSRYEGFATVLVEASRYANYIVSTDVNGARDVTNDFEFGVSFSSKEELKNIISNIVLGNNRKDVLSSAIKNSFYVQGTFNWIYQINNSGLLERLQR